jgi:glycosyltransferase involved in cell wall biosynthesis
MTDTLQKIVKVWPANLGKSVTHPPVSVVTPTYNRRKFLPHLIEIFKAQTYPRERMEWLIYDDGTDKVQDVFAPFMKELNIRYFSCDEKLNIGAKRNRLNDEARGDIIVTMDDDDYYPPERVSHAVNMLLSKKADICGSSKNTLYFTDDASIWEIGPYSQNHATFGTMAYTRNYLKSNRCDETVTHAEEVQFTKRYSNPLVQLDPLKVMLVMCHTENTFNKKGLRANPPHHMKKTGLKLKNWIRSAKERDFYSSA